MDETPQQSAPKKRAAKRFPYSRASLCSVGDQTFEIQLLNISTSGVQFAIRNKIETKEPIRIRWNDSVFGSFNLTFMIAREIHNPESKEFPYFYGAQYYNLSALSKQNLLVLLKNFSEKEVKETKEEVTKVTPGYLFSVIDQRSQFLLDVFKGKSVPLPYFDNILKEVKDYEKAAFEDQSDFAQCIQKLALNNFHCNIMKSIALVVAENREIHRPYFEKLQALLQKVGEVEHEAEMQFKKISEGSQTEEEKKQLRQQINESSNRLFYSKQGLLQLVVETFVTHVTEFTEYKPIFDQVKSHYERIIGLSTTVPSVEAVVYSRKTKKPAEFSRVDAIVDLPVMSEKKVVFFIVFAVIGLFIFGGIWGIMKMTHGMGKDSVKEAIGLQIDLVDYDRIDAQINLVFSSEQWKNLPKENKIEVYQKVVLYLQKHKELVAAVLTDDHHNLIQPLYKSQVAADITSE